jgi:tetrahydromethanopterin S-methyltransferase subunit H
MKFRVGNYLIDAHELDQKLSLNVQSVIGGEVVLEKMGKFIGVNDKVIYNIINLEGMESDIAIKQKNKIFGDYLISFEQCNNGKLELWYTKIDKSYKAFVSQKKINGETLTIAFEKEVK